MDLNRIYTWETPVRLVFGPGSARRAGEELAKLGGRKVLVVTDRGILGAGVLGSVLEGLSTAGVAHAIFDGVEANPTIQCVDAAVAAYRGEGCDALLGVGGGSSMDTAKGVGAVIANEVADFRSMPSLDRVPRPLPPFIAVPTTCGTGSEVSSSALVYDHQERHALRLASRLLCPSVALIDGSLLAKLPGPVVAATGMDALCHALESYVNLNAHPLSGAMGLQAIGLIGRWLRPAVANANLEAMSHMLLASTMAGMAFTNVRLGIVHAMSHSVTTLWGVAHGISNAILLPYVMEFNLIGNPERFADVARAMGEDTSGLTTMEAARLSVQAVRELSADIGIPVSLRALGVTEEHLPEMVRDAMKSGNVAVNPVRVTAEQIAEIYRQAMT